MGGTPSLGGLEDKIGLNHLLSRNRHFLFHHCTHAWMPGHQGVVPGRHVTKREDPIGLCDGKIWIVDGQPPAFHIGMESTLHNKNPAVFRHTNDFLHRLTRQMLVAVSPDVVLVMWVHGQRCIKQHPGTEMRGFIGLNIMKYGIHVHNIHLRSISDHADKRKKPAVLRFNRRRLERKRLSFGRVRQQHHGIL